MWAVAAYVAYWVLRKAIAHRIQEANSHRDAEAVVLRGTWGQSPGRRSKRRQFAVFLSPVSVVRAGQVVNCLQLRLDHV